MLANRWKDEQSWVMEEETVIEEYEFGSDDDDDEDEDASDASTAYDPDQPINIHERPVIVDELQGTSEHSMDSQNFFELNLEGGGGHTSRRSSRGNMSALTMEVGFGDSRHQFDYSTTSWRTYESDVDDDEFGLDDESIFKVDGADQTSSVLVEGVKFMSQSLDVTAEVTTSQTPEFSPPGQPVGPRRSLSHQPYQQTPSHHRGTLGKTRSSGPRGVPLRGAGVRRTYSSGSSSSSRVLGGINRTKSMSNGAGGVSRTPSMLGTLREVKEEGSHCQLRQIDSEEGEEVNAGESVLTAKHENDSFPGDLMACRSKPNVKDRRESSVSSRSRSGSMSYGDRTAVTEDSTLQGDEGEVTIEGVRQEEKSEAAHHERLLETVLPTQSDEKIRISTAYSNFDTPSTRPPTPLLVLPKPCNARSASPAAQKRVLALAPPPSPRRSINELRRSYHESPVAQQRRSVKEIMLSSPRSSSLRTLWSSKDKHAAKGNCSQPLLPPDSPKTKLFDVNNGRRRDDSGGSKRKVKRFEELLQRRGAVATIL